MQEKLSHTENMQMQLNELAALVARLVRALRKAAPTNELSIQAIDYLKRQQLSGSPLRKDLAGKELYRHKKTDGVYEVICNPVQEATGELLVVYRSTETG